MTDNNDINLELNLLENGIDFVLHGIDELFDERYLLKRFADPLEILPSSYKYGTLHLFSGFLLLLKERLARHVPELIYAGKIADAKERLVHNKYPRTVDLDDALERLEIGPRVSFSKDDLQVIRHMQDYRNNFEHFRVSVNKYQLSKTITDFLNLIDKFLVDELQVNIEESAITVDLFGKVQLIEAAWERIEKARRIEIDKELERKAERFEASRDEIIKDLEAEYYIQKGAILLYIQCPNCDDETLIVYGDFAGICTNLECKGTSPITTCDRCGDITTGYSWELNFCNACEEAMNEED
jgi:molecular chaperone GrpE (heat shock protein)